jgi:cytochrome c biogenesis protein CcmG/thiol:disulfide interchange protein DsbE
MSVLLISSGNHGDSGRAPSFTLMSVTNPKETVSLEQFKGRPVVLNFFAAWCVPCRSELPRLQAEHRRVGDQIAFIGVDERDSRNQATDLLHEARVSYPTGYDRPGSVASRYGLHRGLPVTVFIGRNGHVVGKKLGEVSAKELRQWINRLSVKN